MSTIDKHSSREFQVFVKPAGPECNLHCGYCYYLDKSGRFSGETHFRMDDDLLEKYIIQLLEATTDGPVFFAWHGGEPLLAGLDFYRKAVALQKKHLPEGQKIVNGIQTNGTLLNEEWCRFLAEEQFMVGISIDGTEELHNSFRKDGAGNGTFKKVIKGYELLVKHGIIPEILCVVHGKNVGFPLEVYRHFKSLGAEYITFLPLVVPLPGLWAVTTPKIEIQCGNDISLGYKNGYRTHPSQSRRGAGGEVKSWAAVTPESVSPEAYGHFLITIFDEWVANDIGKVKIQVIEEALRTAFGQEHTLCIFKKECGGVPVVEHNGDFFSCDHFVDEAHLLGNLRNQSLSFYLDHPEQKAFGKAKWSTLPDYCLKCEVLPMCNGECPKNRFIRTPEGEPGLNYLCSGYRMFFNHIRPFVEAVKLACDNPEGLN